ncbi:cupin domain-containing protein [Halarcobacter ebronensis]|uniref:Mannose-1-phosphate guanylyltransferase n=1 Tax=Halarcobacter ebronensis TaxID=1462615 RepID=A0A4Q1AQT1_9BACT|nr:cupin domain-containing protein [Halarcobacter ebronensis]QKF83326.1 mannose-1-phosphate guanylyltransferase/mannose-6-phosphate isomerase [Halarcobacter ebronensis]RXK05888.1 mannose-1-phosphate guanylyltransferase [Halarcobacter ebronensis]
MNLEKFIVYDNSSLLQALKRIDENKKGFLVICDKDKKVLGITTEGDIRRTLITGKKRLEDSISYSKEYIFINKKDTFLKLFNYFKLEKINFVPILDNEKKLVNIISKKQFHVMLLKDMEYNISTLPQIDDNELDSEIYEKPWGFYKSTLLAKHVQSKIITLFPKGELSLQKHKRREEHWIVIKGEGEIILEDSTLKAEQGRYVYIPKGCKHKVINTSLEDNLILAEVQLGDYFGEDDIIRYEDKYGRVKNGI